MFMKLIVNGMVLAAIAFLGAFLIWLLCLAIKDGLKKSSRLPNRQAEWHESPIEERTVTAPTAVVASVPRWEREVRVILQQIEEADASDMDWHEW